VKGEEAEGAEKRHTPASVADIVTAIRGDLTRLTVATTPSVRAVRRGYSKALAAKNPKTILAVVLSLAGGQSWAERVVAFELLAGHPGAMRRLDHVVVDRLAQGLSDWGSVDLFGVTVAGVAWRERRLSDGHVRRWARSPDRWRRRLAAVATVPLNSRARGGAGDTTRTLSLCRILLGDRDKMVVKALSWALRELAKRDPDGVTRFVHDEDERLAPRVRREVRAKLETGRKVTR
jgi:3-methyladenine DNA glycosylase AlkD